MVQIGPVGGYGSSGAGNPAGWGSNSNRGQDGTGGLLIVFGKEILGNGSFEAIGSIGNENDYGSRTKRRKWEFWRRKY